MNIHQRIYCKAYPLLVSAVTFLFAATMCSCSSDDARFDDMGGGNYMNLKLIVSMEGISLPEAHNTDATRATPTNGEYMPGEGYENYIPFWGEDSDFKFYLVGNDNRVLCEMDNSNVSPENTISKYYEVNMTVTDEGAIEYLKSGSIKVMMLANWRDYPVAPEGRVIEELVEDATSVFSYTPFKDALGKEHRIPMFGISKFDNLVADEKNTYELGTLHMLRAFAKVEVKEKRDDPDAPMIQKVELVRYTNCSAKAPYNVTQQGDYVFGEWVKDYGNISIPAGATVNGGKAEFGKTKEANPSYIIYCPEYDNTTQGVTPSSILVTYSDGAQYTVDFKNYGGLSGLEKDEVFDIRRNNWYSFILSRKIITPSLDIEIDVQPYASVELTAPLGLMRDNMGDLMVYLVEDTASTEIPRPLVSPANFDDYLEVYGKSLPEDENGVPLIYEDALGDYYAIHFTDNGTMADSEVWLKDRDGCKVLTNFNSEGVREVIEYFALDTRRYRKDHEGEVRLQYNADGSSIVYDKDGLRIFKNAANTERYEVESWDEATGIFYIVTTVKVEGQPDKTVFVEYDQTGKPTGNRMELKDND